MNDHSENLEGLIRWMREGILYTAVEHGMSWNDASQELDAFIAGNTGAYTARIQAIIKEWRTS